MTEIQIKRFFEAYGYKVNTIALDNGHIINVYNSCFKINEKIDGHLEIKYTEIDGRVIEYDFEYDQDCLYSMIIAGWSITHDFVTKIRNEQKIRNEVDQEIEKEISLLEK